MRSQLNPYKKLSGTQSVFLSSYSYWIGKDHLLSVRSTGVSETYRRFYYSDIQSIVIYKTEWYKFEILVLLLIGSFVLIQCLLDDLSMMMKIASAVIGVRLLLYIIRGSTCACYILTAVQNEKIRTLIHTRTARKALKQLLPLIYTAQGIIPYEELKTSYSQDSDHFSLSFQIVPVYLSWHGYLFAVNLLSGLGLIYFFPNNTFPYLAWFLIVSSICAAAAIQNHQFPIHPHIKKAVWGSCGCILIEIALAGHLLYTHILGQIFVMNYENLIDGILNQAVFLSSQMETIHQICGFCTIAVSGCGLFLIRYFYHKTSNTKSFHESQQNGISQQPQVF